MLAECVSSAATGLARSDGKMPGAKYKTIPAKDLRLEHRFTIKQQSHDGMVLDQSIFFSPVKAQTNIEKRIFGKIRNLCSQTFSI